MNMLLFTPHIFKYIADNFAHFLDSNKDNLDKCEYLIPDVVFQAIEDNFATTKVLKTTATWYGVTYKEDAASVKQALAKMVEDGIYPNNLMGKIIIRRANSSFFCNKEMIYLTIGDKNV